MIDTYRGGTIAPENLTLRILQDLPDGNFRDVLRTGKKKPAKGETLKVLWIAISYVPGR